MIREAIEIAEAKLYLKVYDEIQLIAKRAIPLKFSIMDNLGYTHQDTRAFHVTNYRDLDRLVEIQNSENQISTFTQGGPELARLPSQPNILVDLVGVEVIRGKSDIWTLVDKTGTRWIDHQNHSDGKLTFFIDGIITKVFREFNKDLDIERMEESEIYKNLSSLSSREQSKFLNRFVEEIEIFINQGAYKLLKVYLDSSSNMKYNEVILTKFKIVGVFSLAVESPNVEMLCKELKLKYNGVFQRKDLSTLSV